MGRFQLLSRHFVVLFPVLLVISSLHSCMAEDRSDCFEQELLLYVKVVDAETGEDITESGGVENTVLYLFDDKQQFMFFHELSAQQITEREPLVIKSSGAYGMYVSAWGNLDNRVSVTEMSEGSITEELIVSLLKDPLQSWYDQHPGDLFFGFRQMVSSKREEEVVIARKNARLHIVVRGLTNHNLPHFFRILNRQNGYNYYGLPIQSVSWIKGVGVFNEKNEFISPSPYLLIHSVDPERNTEDNSLWIYLYEGQEGEEKEIVRTNRDIKGEYVVLTSGKTTNVLMELSENGGLQVSIEVTPWDEIYQWSDY